MKSESKAFAAIHPTCGIWLPSVRTTEEGSRKTFNDWKSHEIGGWKILPIEIYRTDIVEEKP